jgi:hypothetical protein
VGEDWASTDLPPVVPAAGRLPLALTPVAPSLVDVVLSVLLSSDMISPVELVALAEAPSAGANGETTEAAVPTDLLATPLPAAGTAGTDLDGVPCWDTGALPAPAVESAAGVEPAPAAAGAEPAAGVEAEPAPGLVTLAPEGVVAELDVGAAPAVPALAPAPSAAGAAGVPPDTGAGEAPLVAGAGDAPPDAGAGDEPLDAGAGDEPLDAGAGVVPPVAGVEDAPPVAGAGDEAPDAGAGVASPDARGAESDEAAAQSPASMASANATMSSLLWSMNLSRLAVLAGSSMTKYWTASAFWSESSASFVRTSLVESAPQPATSSGTPTSAACSCGYALRSCASVASPDASVFSNDEVNVTADTPSPPRATTARSALAHESVRRRAIILIAGRCSQGTTPAEGEVGGMTESERETLEHVGARAGTEELQFALRFHLTIEQLVNVLE